MQIRAAAVCKGGKFLDFCRNIGQFKKMKLFIALSLVIAAAFAGYHLSFRRIAGRRSRFSWLHLTGLEFLVIGLLLGPGFFNILDETTIENLAPFSGLALGWVGLLAGFQFEAAMIRRFPPSFFLAALLETGVTILIVFCCIYPLLPLFLSLSGPLQVIAALVLSAAAACTSQSGLVLAGAGHTAVGNKTLRLLRYMVSLEALLPMCLLVWVFFLRPRPSGPNSLVMAGILAAVLAAVLVLYALLLVRRRGTDELALVIIGMTVLTSGAAVQIGFSPLPANFFLGICLVNLTREKEKIFGLLMSIEKPIYLVLLIFLGAQWRLPGFWIALPAGMYFMLRFAGKIVGGWAAVRAVPGLYMYPKLLGLGLLEQGGLALAILLDFQQRFSGPEVSAAVSFALVAVVLAQITSPYLAHRLIREVKL